MDAISEADLFLNFGRDAQAEEVLKEALRVKPSNVPVQLKLLGIYANRKDINAFTSIARQVKDSGDAAAWEHTAALGRTIDPSNPMYGTTGGGQTAAAAAAALAESGKQPSTVPLDMDIGFNIPMDLDVTAATPAVEASIPAMDFDVSGYVAAVPAMDMDVTSEHPAVPEPLLPDFDVTGGHPLKPTTQAMDFDVTGSHPNVTAAPLMDFDVTGSHPNVTAAPAMDFDVTGAHPLAEAPMMDFEVNGGQPVAEEGTAGQGMSTVVLSSPLDFNIAPPSAAATPGGEPFAGVGGMDFDISTVPATQEAPAAEPAALGGMDFDISAPSPAPEKEAEAEPLALGGLDFDISSGLRAPAAPAVEQAPLDLGSMDFDISASAPEAAAKPEPVLDLGLSGISLDLGEADTVVLHADEISKEQPAPEAADEVANKLDLAIAFQKMGDVDTARELLGEVLKEGNAQQVEAARAAMQQL